MQRTRRRTGVDSTKDPALSPLVLDSIAMLDRLLCGCSSPMSQEAYPWLPAPWHLHERAADVTAQQRAAHLDALRRLVLTSELKDPDLASHVVRLSHYSALLARAMGLSSSAIETLSHAVTLHDVGKVGVPDTIFFKPGRLTPNELAVMRSHTVIGGSILASAPCELMRLGCKVALTHHERWDGTGYPRGLRGEQIPLAGRLCAVVDAFDAMTTERPYRQAVAPEAALAEMLDQRGRQFDPQLHCCPRTPAIGARAGRNPLKIQSTALAAQRFPG
ncbi:MAG TPA: HD domain-containing phosphohydrolase [Thermoanaerobaculia bacterium]